MPITKLSDLDFSKRYTFSDYLKWQFEDRVELIKGFLHRMSPAPNLRHQEITTALSALFWGHFRGKECKVFTAPFDVRLNETTIVQPDICVVCDPAKLDKQGCNGAPDLVVEVLSPGNSKREMKEKYEAYESAGVREYWIVNPEGRTVLVYVLNEENRYIGLAPVTDEQYITPTIFPELSIDLREVFSVT